MAQHATNHVLYRLWNLVKVSFYSTLWQFKLMLETILWWDHSSNDAYQLVTYVSVSMHLSIHQTWPFYGFSNVQYFPITLSLSFWNMKHDHLRPVQMVGALCKEEVKGNISDVMLLKIWCSDGICEQFWFGLVFVIIWWFSRHYSGKGDSFRKRCSHEGWLRGYTEEKKALVSTVNV